MKAKLGDTIEFDYTAPDIHDTRPRIFFLAKTGNLVHGLNQHYQTPTEKIYYFYSLKKIFYNDVLSNKITPQSFYKNYVKNRLLTNSYRTYKTSSMSNIQKISSALWNFTPTIDVIKGKPYSFFKGEKVQYLSLAKGKLVWKKGEVTSKKSASTYTVKLKDGTLVSRHASDLRKI